MSSTATEENSWWRRWALIVMASLAVMMATRWPLVPTRHLYGVDNVNFALALDHFNPALDQPPPPGDPLYVALTRWMRPFVPSVEILFPLSGVLGSAAAVAALWWVAEMLFGARAGGLAALLLAFNPIFWLAGVGNYARMYLALGAAMVAGLVWKSMSWKSMSSSSSPGKPLDGSFEYFCASAAALGLFAGFRPEMGVLLTPLVLVPGRLFVPETEHKAPWWQWVVAAGCFAATTLPWLLVTAWHTGGLAGFVYLNREYLAMQWVHNSWFYGASLAEGLGMAAASVYWNLLGAFGWIVFVPQVWDRLCDRREAWFLALWFVPPFLFYTFVHNDGPEQTLVAIPALCMAGAWTLTRLPDNWFWWAAPAALAANVVLFFYPTGSPFRDSNYRIAEYTIRSAEQVYARVGLFEKLGPVTVLTLRSYITPREIGYYYPRVRIVNLDASPASAEGDVEIPAGRVIWLDPAAAEEGAKDAHAFDGLREAAGGQPGAEGQVHWANLETGARFRVGDRWVRVVARNAPRENAPRNATIIPTRP